MTDQQPQVAWQPAGGPAAEVASRRHRNTCGGSNRLERAAGRHRRGCGAPPPTWEHAGTLTLKAAGLETVASSEAHNTWLEILGQSLSALARSDRRPAGRRSHSASAGAERASAPESTRLGVVSLAFAEWSLPPLLVAFSPEYC